MHKYLGTARRHPVLVSVSALLLVFFLIASTSALYKYLTVDESVYLASGYSYLKTGDFRVNVEHPALGRMVFSLPLLLFNPELPLGEQGWEKSANQGDVGGNYGFASDFYWANEDSFGAMAFSSRLVVIMLTAFMGVLVFLWSRELFGTKGGLLSLALFAFAPNIIAHSRLATLDMPLTVFIFASFYFAHVFAQGGKLKWLFVSAIFLSFAVLTKFSALFFFPLLFLFIAMHHRSLSENRARLFRGKHVLFYYAFAFAVLALAPLVAANFVYSFDGYNVPNYYGVIPARLFEGFMLTNRVVGGGRVGYLFGEFNAYMPHYFLAAFLMKATIAFLALLIASFYFFARRPELKYASLLVPALGFFAFNSFFVKFYLGLRYVLPCFPFLFVFCGILLSGKRGKAVMKDRRLLAAFVLLLSFHALSSLSVYPHYLAYFNEAIGPDNAAEYLSDSNLDWGQDLLLFMEYVRAQGIESVNFIYFGWPFYGENFQEAYFNPSCEPIDGKIAISATYLVGRNAEEFKCYSWLREREPMAKIGHTIYYYEVD